mgnify:CR=1 FL=1
MNKGLLIVVSAPSGCGKGTILSEVLKDDRFYYSVSATTRSPRLGEVNGVTYHFITKQDFEERIKNNAMLEYAEYCGNYYGTPKKEIDEMWTLVYNQLDRAGDAVLTLDRELAQQVLVRERRVNAFELKIDSDVEDIAQSIDDMPPGLHHSLFTFRSFFSHKSKRM